MRCPKCNSKQAVLKENKITCAKCNTESEYLTEQLPANNLTEGGR